MENFAGWALIVVDMQNDFLAQEGYYARRERYRQQVRQKRLSFNDMINQLAHPNPAPTKGFTPRAASLTPIIRNTRRVIARAQEHHIPIAYLQAVYSHTFPVKPSFLVENPERIHYPCKPNTWGAEIIAPIKEVMLTQQAQAREKVIAKHTFNGFFETDLCQFLRKWKIHTVVLVGTETHICVLATAQGASYNQFKTIILHDCVATDRAYQAKYALNIFRDGFGTTKLSTQIF